jgi:hypothetical protein
MLRLFVSLQDIRKHKAVPVKTSLDEKSFVIDSRRFFVISDFKDAKIMNDMQAAKKLNLFYESKKLKVMVMKNL